MSNSPINIGPSVCFKVQKIIGVSIGEGNLKNYQVQWAPSWVSGFHLVGCEKLIEEFVGREGTDTGASCSEAACVSPTAAQLAGEVGGSSSNSEFSTLTISYPEEKECHEKLSTDDPCTSGIRHEENQAHREVEQENPNFEWISSGREVKKMDFTSKSKDGGADAVMMVQCYSEHEAQSYQIEDSCEFSSHVTDVLKLEEDIIIVEPSECEELIQSKKKLPHKCSKCQNASFRTAIELQRHCKRVHSSKKKVDNILSIVEQNKNNGNSKAWVNSVNPGVNEISTDNQKDLANLSESNSKGIDHNNNTATSNSSINNNTTTSNSSINSKYNVTIKHRVKPTFNEKTYKCGVCSKMFSNNSNLHVHMRLHTGQRAHQCGFCSKLFPSKTELRRHERVHTGERPFLCRVCHKTFKRNDHLKKHLQTHRIMM